MCRNQSRDGIAQDGRRFPASYESVRSIANTRTLRIPISFSMSIPTAYRIVLTNLRHDVHTKGGLAMIVCVFSTLPDDAEPEKWKRLLILLFAGISGTLDELFIHRGRAEGLRPRGCRYRSVAGEARPKSR